MAKFHYRESPTDKQTKAFKKYLSEDEELVLVTGLSRAYMRKFGICRLCFRELAHKGEIPGVKKASW